MRNIAMTWENKQKKRNSIAIEKLLVFLWRKRRRPVYLKLAV